MHKFWQFILGVIPTQIIHDFGLSICDYIEHGENRSFPVFSFCPICNAQKELGAHGFYYRNVVLISGCVIASIRRYYCSCCGKTISLLPSFLLPYFQHPLAFILEELHAHFCRLRAEFKAYLQLRQFFVYRFLKNLNRIEAFFRDFGFLGALPPPEREKATNLIDMIASQAQKPFHKGFTVISIQILWHLNFTMHHSLFPEFLFPTHLLSGFWFWPGLV